MTDERGIGRATGRMRRDDRLMDEAPPTAQMLPVITEDLAQVREEPTRQVGVSAREAEAAGTSVTPQAAAGAGERGADETTEKSEKGASGVSPTSLVAGAAAAATSSVIGGQLGVGGTVVGAGLASVVTAVAVTLYSRGLDKGREKVQRVVATIAPGEGGARPAATRVLGASAVVSDGRAAETATAAERDTAGSEDGEDRTWRQTLRRKRVLYPVIIGAVTFVVGIGAVVVAESVTDSDISPGTSQISRSLSGGSGDDTSESGGADGDSSGSVRDSGQQGADTRQGSTADDGTGDGSGTDRTGTQDQQSTGEDGAEQDSGTGADEGSGQDSGRGTGPGSGKDTGQSGSSGSGSSGSGGSSSGGSAGGDSDTNSQNEPGTSAGSGASTQVEARAG